VLPIDLKLENAKKIEAGALVWGCPVSASTSLDQASSWARERLGSR
jgi:hypothetical protein